MRTVAWMGMGLILMAHAGCAQDAESWEAIGAISHVLPDGRHDAWLGERDGGVYRVTTFDRSIVQYYFLDPVPGTEGQREISVRIAVDSAGEDTRAGLIYGVTADPTTYYLYLLEPDGRVVLFHRETTGALTEVWSGRARGPTGDFVTLGLAERDGQLRLLIDGEDVGSIRSEVVGRGGAGIAAGGTGRFAFTAFRHQPEPRIPGQALQASADREVSEGWRLHQTPGVFSVAHPEGWKVRFDARQGFVELTADREAVYIWPVRSRRALDQASAAALLGDLATRLAPDARWQQAVAVAPNAIRMETRDGRTTTVASLQWFSNAHGSAAFCYVASAPSDRYAERAPTIARILASFRPDMSGAEGDRRPAPGPSVQFTHWQDPNEGAFHVQVPAGWRVGGGLQRRTAIDYQRGVNVVSPDGEVSVMLMDPDIPFFTLPNEMTAFLGQQEGTWYTAPDGTRMLIRRYVQGGDFAHEFVMGRFAQSLPNFRIEGKQNRPDLAAAVEREYAALNEAAAGFMRFGATAGEVFFSGGAGTSYRGYLAATTVLAQYEMGGVWEVRQLYGLVAPSERLGEAAMVMERLVSSFQWDPQWFARQHQTRAQVSTIMQDYGKRMSEIIGRTFPESTRRAQGGGGGDRFSEYIRGTVTVQDEEGERFEVWNTSNYYWMDVFQDVTGTMLSPNPDVSRFRELVIVR